MATRLCLFCLVFLFGSTLTLETPLELIIWNVGQGQWVTLLDDQACWHLDMGGEFAPWKEIMQRCRRRPNRISLSHWDMDHIGFLRAARRHLPQLCLIHRPEGVASAAKMAMLEPVPTCLQESPFADWSNPNGKTANAKSWVVLWRQVLAPGDSPRDQEKKWIHKIVGLSDTRILILGHHGSQTSTSRELLHHLPQLKMAISSARYRRYRHPHSEVIRELEELKIPLLRTEEWGSIHIFL